MFTSIIRKWLINNVKKNANSDEMAKILEEVPKLKVWKIGMISLLFIMILEIFQSFAIIMAAGLVGIMIYLSTSSEVLAFSTQTLFWVIVILYLFAALKTYKRRKTSKLNGLLYYLILPALFIANLAIL